MQMKQETLFASLPDGLPPGTAVALLAVRAGPQRNLERLCVAMASIYTAFDDMAGPLTAPAEKKLEGMPQAEACGAPCVKIATCASASCSLSLCLAVSLSRCLSLSLSLSLPAAAG